MHINVPSIHNDKHELADVIEWNALEHPTHCSSIAALRSAFSAPDDEFRINGVEEGDDRAVANLLEAQQECSVRGITITVRYPFRIEGDACFLLLEEDNRNFSKWVYLFLLMVTRMNMQTEKVQGGLDATKIFERLCSQVIREYLGEHSKSRVIGTARSEGFKEKFTSLLKNLNIDGECKEPLGCTGAMKDGGIDVVAWIPFADQKDSQLIALGQCKTGTTWHDKIQKSKIFPNFSTRQPMTDIVDFYFVAEAIGIYKWEETSRKGGILFDRIRIMEYLPNQIDENLKADIVRWLNSTFEKIGIDIRYI